MELLWLILFLFMIVEIILVSLLCMPMPSNDVRGKVNKWVASLWHYKPVKYSVFVLIAIDAGYFCFVADALLHPFYDFGILSPAVNMGISCEYKQDLFYNERNASITGASVFLFFVLRRLVDIQDKLFTSRGQVKALLGNGGDGGAGMIKGDNQELLKDGSKKDN